MQEKNKFIFKNFMEKISYKYYLEGAKEAFPNLLEEEITKIAIDCILQDREDEETDP